MLDTSVGLSTPPTLSSLRSIPPGIRHMAASAFFFSLMSMLVKLAGDRLPSHQIVLVRAVVCLVLSWITLRGAGISPWGGDRVRLVLRGVLGTVSLVCFYYSLVHVPFAEAAVLQHVSPVLTATMAIWFLRERPSPRLWAAIACSLVGVLLIARPALVFGGVAVEPHPWGVAAGLVGALCTAFVFVLIRSMGGREHPLVVVFYFPLVAVPLVLPLAIPQWVWPTPTEWLILVGVGVATQLAQVHMTRGIALTPAGRASAVGYLQVVLAALWGALIFDEIPDRMTIGGAALIVGATLAVAFGRSDRPATTEQAIVEADQK